MKEIPINFEQPMWLLLLVLILAISVSAVLYYRNSNHEFGKRLLWSLASIRFVVVFILGLLLLNPFFIEKTKTLEKPIVVLAMDRSESMLNTQDSAEFTEEITELSQQLISKLSEQFQVDVLGFDFQVYENQDISFKAKRTDIGKLLDYIDSKYYMLNTAAIVLMTDGNNNQGFSPEYVDQQISAEIYPIVYGDTAAQLDLAIDAIYYNKVVRQNASFPIDVVLQADGMNGQKISVQLEHQGRIIETKDVRIIGDSFNKEVRFEMNALMPGLQAYKVHLISAIKEQNSNNNSNTFYVQVVESGTKILVLGHHPHPDLGAIATALRSVESFDVDVKTLIDYPINLSKYQLVLLHGLPANDERSKRLFSDNKLKQKALWYILSQSTDYALLAQLNIPWIISDPKGVYEYAEPLAYTPFSTFQMPTNWSHAIHSFPPLYIPFSNFESLAKSDVMLKQSIRGFDTEKPLQLFWSKGGKKYALLSGEGIWKWRLYNYKQYGDNQIFNDFIVRSSKYLLTATFSDRFNIQYQNIYNETDLIVWEAQVFNKAYEPEPQAEVSVEITDDEGHLYSYLFSPERDFYSVHIDHLEAGEYTFKATAQLSDTLLYKEGKFVVNAWNMEQSKITANTELLSRLAQHSGGKVYFPSQANQLVESLLNHPEYKSRSSYIQKLINLIDVKWLAVLLVLLLGAEWLLRKRNGTY